MADGDFGSDDKDEVAMGWIRAAQKVGLTGRMT